MKILGITTATILAITGIQILDGFVLSTLWGWFIVPTFSCVSLSIPAAIGVAIVARHITTKIDQTKIDQTKINEKEKNEKFEELFIRTIAFDVTKSVMALLFGFIVKLFM